MGLLFKSKKDFWLMPLTTGLSRLQEAVLEISEDIQPLPVRDPFAPATSGRLNSGISAQSCRALDRLKCRAAGNRI
jgi:hypothetical protein